MPGFFDSIDFWEGAAAGGVSLFVVGFCPERLAAKQRSLVNQSSNVSGLWCQIDNRHHNTHINQQARRLAYGTAYSYAPHQTTKK